MRYHIVNPAAGKGRAASYVSAKEGERVYVTKAVGDARKFVCRSCSEDAEPRFIVYGGDGTLNEVVCGIMTAGAGRRAVISVVPVGSGNDFARNFTEKGIYDVDVMKLGDRWAVNMLNTGFDCTVVSKIVRYQRLPLISGSFAYVLGVVDTLLRDMGEPFRVTLEKEDGERLEFTDGGYLLCAVSNGGYCGGGFHSSPLVSLDDGLLDVLVVKKISRRRFIKLVGDYKAGTHIDAQSGQPIEKFADIMSYVKCRAVGLENMSMLCIDGECRGIHDAYVTVVKKAVRFEV